MTAITRASLREAAERLGLTDAKRLLDGKALSPDSELVRRWLARPDTRHVVQLQATRAVHAYDLSPDARRELALRSAGWPDTVEAAAHLLAYGGLLRLTLDDRLHVQPLRDRRYTPEFPSTGPKQGSSWTGPAKERSRLLKSLSRKLLHSGDDADAAAALLQLFESPYLKARLRSSILHDRAHGLWLLAYPDSKLASRIKAPVIQCRLAHEVADLCLALSRVHEQKGAQHAAALHAFEAETREFFRLVVGGPVKVNLNQSTKKPTVNGTPHLQGWYLESSYYLACSVFPHLHDEEGRKAWLHIVGQRGKPHSPADYGALYPKDRLFAAARKKALPWLRSGYPACSRRKQTWKQPLGPWEVLARHLTFYDLPI